jgi:hypothetical protein
MPRTGSQAGDFEAMCLSAPHPSLGRRPVFGQCPGAGRGHRRGPAPVSWTRCGARRDAKPGAPQIPEGALVAEAAVAGPDPGLFARKKEDDR